MRLSKADTRSRLRPCELQAASDYAGTAIKTGANCANTYWAAGRFDASLMDENDRDIYAGRHFRSRDWFDVKPDPSTILRLGHSIQSGAWFKLEISFCLILNRS
jgi:hypothetical protein